MKKILLSATLAVAAQCGALAPALAQSADAPQCGELYTVKTGDTLSDLARAIYGDASDWSLIYYANQRALGGNPSLLVVGAVLRLPCLPRAEEAAEIAEAAPEPAPQPATTRTAVAAPGGAFALLTADEYRPFTDRSLPRGGMITELVSTALTESKTDFKVSWINDWSSHLEPLLKEHHYDLGFPWAKPRCEETPDNIRCTDFLFSDPIFEMLGTLFVRADSDFDFAQDSDAEGRTFCRPAGYATFDLDSKGRNWLKDDKIILMQPRTAADCFRLLAKGAVDAVSVNEFEGRQTVADLDMRDQVRMLRRALSVQTLHLIVPKAHPRATVILYKVNEALEGLRQSGGYDEIVGRHLALFWRNAG